MDDNTDFDIRACGTLCLIFLTIYLIGQTISMFISGWNLTIFIIIVVVATITIFGFLLLGGLGAKITGKDRKAWKRWEEQIIIKQGFICPECKIERVPKEGVVCGLCILKKIEEREKAKEQYRSRSIPAHVRREVWRRDNGRCVDCGSRERLEYDHIIPFSKGGSNTARNIELRCEECNRKKSDSI